MKQHYGLPILVVFITALVLPTGANAQRPSLSGLQEQINQLPPAWHRILNDDSTPQGEFDPCESTLRFTCVISGIDSTALLDHETGLVWERDPFRRLPDPSTPPDQLFPGLTWPEAFGHCYARQVGQQVDVEVSRKGWRLPTIFELATLIKDGSVNPNIPGVRLPRNIPWVNVSGDDGYWTSTTDEIDVSKAWFVDFSDGSVGTLDKSLPALNVWCVRAAK